ncbi:MAG: hypothetical protein Q8L78_02065 [Coxiellaceae bacterium]|nr:hypothetical protein [Coxiellaceae bacterium]
MKPISLLIAASFCTAVPFTTLAETTQNSKPIVLAERVGGHGFQGGKNFRGGQHGRFQGSQGQRATHHSSKNQVRSNQGSGQKQTGLQQNNQNLKGNSNWKNNGYHQGWNGYHNYNNTNVYYVNGYPYNGWYNGSYLWGGVAAMGLIAGTYYYAGKAYSTSAQCYGACAAANNPTVNCHSVCNY